MPGGGTSEKLTVTRSPRRRTEKESAGRPAGGGAVPGMSGESAACEPGKTNRWWGFGYEEQPASNKSAPRMRVSPDPRFGPVSIISSRFAKRNAPANQS